MARYCPIITNHTSMESFQTMYKSTFQKSDPCDWLSGSGSRIVYLIDYIPVSDIQVLPIKHCCHLVAFCGTGAEGLTNRILAFKYN